MIRKPVVAGQFYPEKKEELQSMIDFCFNHKFGPSTYSINPDEKIFGIICPHAGYVYSGPIASYSYKSISSQIPEIAIIIGPNHFGIGTDAATMVDADWETPLGTVSVDSESALDAVKNSEIIEVDNYSHSQDHSLEVQIPFLQSIFDKKFKILPIILRAQDMITAKDVGNTVYEIAKKKKSIVIGSPDCTTKPERKIRLLIINNRCCTSVCHN